MSLRTRLLLTASAVLLVFIALCGLGLETAFRDAAQAAQRERMQGLVYGLLGASDARDNGELSPDNDSLPEPRLRQPQSGLEAVLLREDGAELWRSPGATGDLPLVIGPEVGRWRFERLEVPPRFVLSFGLRWIRDDGVPSRYTLVVLEEPSAYLEQLAAFRRTLWAWLMVAAAGLLAALLAVLHWGLSPLRRLTHELRDVESGQESGIPSKYPAELRPLTDALNAMIRNERNQQTRYRNALGDLAHSLKTPLAVLRGLGPQAVAPDARSQFDEQLGRMQEIADHQLSRAATAGRRTLARPVAVQPVAEKIAGALRKVYADRALHIEVAVPRELRVRVDGGDLYEIAGNVLDNAAKWARRSVRVTANRDGGALVLRVEDDGPGFPDQPRRLLERGARADSRVPGQGLGLASVSEIVQAYEGTVALERSAELGGARVVLRIAGV